MRRLLFLLGLIGLLAAPALADVTVRYKVKDQANKAITLAVADNGDARFDSGDGTVLIVRDGVRYFIASDRHGPFVGRVEDGITILTEFVSAMMRMMEQAARQAPAAGQGQAAPSQNGLAQIRAMAQAPYAVQTRGQENVGGRSGTLYVVAPAQPGAPGPSLEMVIATDADLAPVGAELRRLIGLASEPARTLLGQQPDILTELDGVLARGFPIRIGQHFRLDSVSADPIPASSFALPGPPLSLEALRARAPITGMMTANEPDPNPNSDNE